MKERPILFSGAMVRAILAGTKTQTRRVVKHCITGPNLPANIFDWHHQKTGDWLGAHGGGIEFGMTSAARLCPYGQPGDRLYVREAWAFDEEDNRILYRSDDNEETKEWDQARAESGLSKYRWRPSIHMPRAVSRILLEIVSVRVERLQDISDADAIAEGIERNAEYPTLWKRGDLHGDQNIMKSTGFPKLAYRSIWEQINGHESWSANPWIWVVEFKRVEVQP